MNMNFAAAILLALSIFALAVVPASPAVLTINDPDATRIRTSYLFDIQRWVDAPSERPFDDDARVKVSRNIPKEHSNEIERQIVMGGSLALALLIAFYIRLLSFRHRRGEAKAKLTRWRALFDNANHAWCKLEGEYLDFLNAAQSTDWKKKFTGQTLSQYTVALTEFNELSIRMKFAQKRLDDADREFKKGSFFFLAGFDRTIALLNKEVTLPGQEPQFENLTLFGSPITDIKFEPEALLADMEQLFQSCNRGCASIMKAFDGAMANDQMIQSMRDSIEAMRTTLLENGLSFAPYQARYVAAINEQAAFRDILASNPVEAFAQSEFVRRAVNQIKDDVRRVEPLQL